MGYKDYLAKAKTIKITDHFTLYDICHSDAAEEFNLDNTPTTAIIANAVFLIKKVLEPIRMKFNKPVIVDCIYRSLAVNLKVGGTMNPPSQHMKGQAADIYIKGVSNADIVNYIRKNLDFDQVILEASWVHVSYKTTGNRKEVWKCINGKYIKY